MSDGCDLDTLLDVLSDDEDLDGDLEGTFFSLNPVNYLGVSNITSL